MTTLLSIALASTLATTGTQASELVFEGLGSHKRTVTTSSPIAQRYFNQGLCFMYAFNHDEAIRAFKEAARVDPNCGMAWWGIATANGPHINNSFVPDERAKAAVDALRKAKGLRSRVTPVEKALIDAAAKRFAYPQPKDRTKLDRTYADAMRSVWQSYPKDADVGALFAESLMDLRPWDLWKPNGKPQPGTMEVTNTLTKVMKLNRDHPLALHLAIHAWEASPWPDRADDAANRLRNLQPGLGHMVHMPSHIDVLRGRWEEAIVANEKAIIADDTYRKRRPRQGFYSLYMAHNRHMLGFAAMMVGQRQKTIKAFDEMVARVPTDWLKENAAFIDGMMFMPVEARVRFGRWDEVLAWPEYPEYQPLSRALRHMARGVAYAAKGMPFEAEAERMLFLQAKTKVPAHFTVGNNPATLILNIAEHLLNGEIHLAKDEHDAAIRELRRSVFFEDQMRYDEPPDWILPIRHVLGVALLDAGRYAEAEKAYREDLKRLPNNGWSLNGLAEALRKQGRAAEAEKYAQQFAAVWRNSDTPITSSCMCVPNPGK